MKSNTQLETIRQACIKANPEIVELKFGCEVKDICDGKVWKFLCLEKNGSWKVTIAPSGTGIGRPEEFEVLGRPIRLADVLLAIKEKSGNDDEIFVFAGGNFSDGEVVNDCVMPVHGVEWNLRADDLTQQSEETKNFLYELLK